MTPLPLQLTTWFMYDSSANVEYEEALAQIHFLSNIHAKVLDIKLSSKEIVPENDAKYWLNLALNNSTSSLIQSLAALNSIIQGLNTLNGISIVGVYSNNVKATETEGSKHKLRTHTAG